MSSILDRLYDSHAGGSLLERVVTDVLLDAGFSRVQRHLSGNPGGFELVAMRFVRKGRPEVWKIECRDPSIPLEPSDIMMHFAWDQPRASFDRLVLVSLVEADDALTDALNTHPLGMPITVWDGACIEQLVGRSARARRTLELPAGDPGLETPSVPAGPTFPPYLPVSMDVFPFRPNPRAFDYLEADGIPIRAFVDQEFMVQLTIDNQSPATLQLRSLVAVTVRALRVEGRVVRLSRAGRMSTESPNFTAAPRWEPGAGASLLEGQVWPIQARHAELVTMQLAEGLTPGLYDVFFRATGRLGHQNVTLESARFWVHVAAPGLSILPLWSHGSFPDDAAVRLLGLEAIRWDALLKERLEGGLCFIGPTEYELLNGIVDQDWKVRRAAPRGACTPHSDLDAPGTVLVELGGMGGGEAQSLEAIGRAVAGPEAIDVFAMQLARRRRREEPEPTGSSRSLLPLLSTPA